MGEPIGMIASIVIFLIILCTALLSGSADIILQHSTIINWIVLLVFVVITIIQIKDYKKKKANPFLAYFSPIVSQFSFAFFLMLIIRDLSLVAKEGVFGLFGFILLFPLYGIGLSVCRVPNIISHGETAPKMLIFDAVATPVLIVIASWIFGFFDSVPYVLESFLKI